MTSERQKASNRANSQKSTGPKSTVRSAKNALRHGLSQSTPDLETSARAQALAEAICREGFGLDPAAALSLAEAVCHHDRVRRAVQDELQRGLQTTDPSLPWALRQDMARLAVLQRLVALENHERRAAGRLRKQFRRLVAAEPAEEM